ncbi:1-acyl-sn-glycerol-3-phosphate acyltransferase [Acetobacteroides hydrogenigenes]|uniref:1-acyl-sn-glycerol-3-phosphate acyltransferase n=2 Tax=Acetobacteroides hydrogenigenes TaxID=979970 RepID=A0A4R2EW32_9BACT|nr:1-acyl-sn-glycerol-3-phosphate acyltransferase [Acetobacteroides hydrogenigenes]
MHRGKWLFIQVFKMKKFLVLIYLVLYIALSCALFIPVVPLWLVCLLCNKEIAWLNSYRFWWGRLYFNISPGWIVQTEGMENIDTRKPYIIISNHQSALDIPFSAFIRTQFNWVSKFEVLYIPIIGWLMWMCRDIPIKRGQSRSARMMIHQVANKVAHRRSVLLYPEGTRSSDGQVKRFKEGAFVVAKANKIGILPVVIDGTFDAMPKGKFGFKLKQVFRMRVLPEFTYQQMENLSPREIAQQLENVIRKEHMLMAPDKYRK